MHKYSKIMHKNTKYAFFLLQFEIMWYIIMNKKLVIADNN